MVQREWVEKDFYKVLGVSSDAKEDEIKRVARKLLAENHPDRNPNDPAAEERYKAIGEAKDVLLDQAKRKEYDETRRMFAGGGFGRRFNGGGGGGGGFSPGDDGTGAFNLNDLFGQAGQDGGANIGDLFGGLFGRGAAPRPSRPRRGKDLETETQLDFLEATKGVAMPLRMTSQAPCTNCHGSGARPGTSPKVCSSCNGSGVINRNQGAFGSIPAMSAAVPASPLAIAPLPFGFLRAWMTVSGSGWQGRVRPDYEVRRQAISMSPCMCVRTGCSVVTAMI